VFARVLGCAAVAAFALGACVPPEPSNDLVQDYDETTAMGGIQAAGVLRIGLEEDAFPLGGEGADPAGFTFEIGREVADSLGVEADFVVGPPDALLRMIDEGDLDVAFPLDPVTEAAVRKHAYSDPWWVGHQRLLVTDERIQALGDLAGVAVCDAPDPATGIPIADLVPEVGGVVSVDDARGCRTPLRRGRAQAASGPDVLLLSLLPDVAGSRIIGEQQTTAGYGVVMSKDSVGLNVFVDLVLREIDSEGRWERWYEKYVAPVTGEPSPGIPTMTIEEAAALYPK
jgi:polar amino acid transport system substrate-binding protein